MIRSLFARLLISYVLISLLTLLVVSLVLSGLFGRFYYSFKERELVSRGNEIGELLSASLGEQKMAEIDSLFRILRYDQRTPVLFVDREGLRAASIQNLAISPGLDLKPAESSKLLRGETVTWQIFNRRLNQLTLAAAVPFHIQNQVAGAILLFTPVADIRATIGAVRRLILYSAGIAVFLSIIPCYFLSRSISRPIRQMSRLTLEMASGNFRQKAPVTSQDEIGQLAENFNHLAVNLDQSISALLQEKVKNENILLNMAEGVIATEHQGWIILFNPGAERVLGLKQEEVLNRSLDTIDGCQQLAALFREVMDTGEQRSGEFAIVEGKIFILARVAPLRQKENEIYGTVGVLQDITEFKKLDNLRRDFIANVSHELRTPLTSIQGFVEALIDGMANDKSVQEQYLDVIHRESLRLGRLTQDLLDLALLESKKVNWEITPIDASALFNRVLIKLKPQLEEKKVKVKQETDCGLPMFLGNRDRIDQVMINLLHNAITFSPPEGIINLQASLSGEKVKISIRDQGPGIPPADLPYIWDRFYRVEKSRSRALGGTGLGLSIVKHIIENHGGQVAVESQVGAGSTFIFALPVAAADFGGESAEQPISRR